MVKNWEILSIVVIQTLLRPLSNNVPQNLLKMCLSYLHNKMPWGQENNLRVDWRTVNRHLFYFGLNVYLINSLFGVWLICLAPIPWILTLLCKSNMRSWYHQYSGTHKPKRCDQRCSTVVTGCTGSVASIDLYWRADEIFLSASRTRSTGKLFQACTHWDTCLL